MKTGLIFKSLILAVSMTLVGCASSSARKGQTPAKESNAPDDLQKDKNTDPNKKIPATTDGYICDDEGFEFTQGKTKIDGTNLSLYTGRSKSKKTLCEVLKSTGKKAAIFQFAGWSCISCMEEAEDLQKFVKSSKGKDIAHILVFTDLFEDSEDSDFEKFIDKYAPDATVMYDESKLWKYYSKDPTLPSRATIMTMNLNAEGHVQNEEGQFSKIKDVAIELAKKI
jgi:thiol-disulfide isomerase/thioredoxin